MELYKINHCLSTLFESPGAFFRRPSLWQGKKASNPRPTVLETAALPAELYPYIQKSWWAFGDSNPGPTGYEPAALTN